MVGEGVARSKAQVADSFTAERLHILLFWLRDDSHHFASHISSSILSDGRRLALTRPLMPNNYGI